jgi:hypothetical protein
MMILTLYDQKVQNRTHKTQLACIARGVAYVRWCLKWSAPRRHNLASLEKDSKLASATK